MKVDKKQKFFTTYELAKADWFPVRSQTTILSLIKSGELKAINVSAIKGKVKYSIPESEIINYLKNTLKKYGKRNKK